MKHHAVVCEALTQLFTPNIPKLPVVPPIHSATTSPSLKFGNAYRHWFDDTCAAMSGEDQVTRAQGPVARAQTCKVKCCTWSMLLLNLSLTIYAI